MTAATYTIVRCPDAPPVIRCDACKSEERYWDERAASKWKARRAANCAGHQPRLEGES